MKIWFGEHKGKDVSDLPDSYLRWLTHEASPPRPRNDADFAEKKELREKWMDLLCEAEEEISERE